MLSNRTRQGRYYIPQDLIENGYLDRLREFTECIRSVSEQDRQSIINSFRALSASKFSDMTTRWGQFEIGLVENTFYPGLLQDKRLITAVNENNYGDIVNILHSVRASLKQIGRTF